MSHLIAYLLSNYPIWLLYVTRNGALGQREGMGSRLGLCLRRAFGRSFIQVAILRLEC